MSKNIYFPVLLVGIISSAFARDMKQGGKDTIFVGNLKVVPSVVEQTSKQGKQLSLKRIQDTLDSQLISALNATRQFQLVDRKRLNVIIEEQKLNALGQIDPSDPNAAQAMKLAGAKYVFLPQIDAYEDRTEMVKFQQVGRTEASRKVFLSVVVQITDTTTGELLPDSPSVQLEKVAAVDMARSGQALESDRILVELSKEMARQLAQRVVGTLRPAKVLSVHGSRIMINRGTESGFNKGVIVEVYAVDKIEDEDTGEVFLDEMPVAQAKVVQCDAKKSFAMIQGDDMGAAKGCIVRVVQSFPATPSASQPATSSVKQVSGSSMKSLDW